METITAVLDSRHSICVKVQIGNLLKWLHSAPHPKKARKKGLGEGILNRIVGTRTIAHLQLFQMWQWI
jgi:hypothetical protein